MKKLIIICLVLLPSFSIHAATKERSASANWTWEDLDKRPIPDWFNEAKFGIFIVWGPYSVPAYRHIAPGFSRGYAEWYWDRIRYADSPTAQFHRRVYGEDFKYEQFADQFKGELFDADFWADIIAQSGAKYVSFTVNYHDGFAMWPTQYAKTMNTDKWNAVVTGPKRDVTAELKKAIEKKDIKFGIYYSLMEWHHPLYHEGFRQEREVLAEAVRKAKEKDPTVKPHTVHVDWRGQDYIPWIERFGQEWMIPKFKEVVSRYEPWFIFLDGEWHFDWSVWHSDEMAAWLYTESPVRDRVVVNDRWGSTRGKHGDVFSSEYGGATGWKGHPWQEDRGIGFSYGYNRAENINHYNSPGQLIDTLTKCAMNGGNFLLDIGPAGDGRIPVIMQERLLQIGQWLKVNGEAIYGSRRNPITHEGDVRYTRKGNCLYAVCMKWPGETLTLEHAKPAEHTEIKMLGVSEPLKWEMKDKKLCIQIPQLTIDKLPCEHAWVIKIIQ